MPDDIVVVTFMNGPADGRSVVAHNPRVSIGRGPDNAVAIDFDAAVIDRHLEILHQEGQWQLVTHDEGGRVLVNGTRVYGRIAMPTDSLVRLGDTLIRVVVGGRGAR